MSPAVALLAPQKHSFPRVSGDEPGPVPVPSPPLLFSPRERG